MRAYVWGQRDQSFGQAANWDSSSTAVRLRATEVSSGASQGNYREGNYNERGYGEERRPLRSFAEVGAPRLAATLTDVLRRRVKSSPPILEIFAPDGRRILSVVRDPDGGSQFS